MPSFTKFSWTPPVALACGLLFASFTSFTPTSAIAEELTLSPTPLDPNVHSPVQTTQTLPMRVQILNATSFFDVATDIRYRLYGVDACDRTQMATLTRQQWNCGVVAEAWLINATVNKWVACTPVRMEGEIVVSRCATSEFPDIAAEMLKQGLAVLLPNSEDRAIKSYAGLETSAKTEYRGLWGSQFQMPWAFRADKTTQPKPTSSQIPAPLRPGPQP